MSYRYTQFASVAICLVIALASFEVHALSFEFATITLPKTSFPTRNVSAYSINDKGEIVGEWNVGSPRLGFHSPGFLYRGGHFISLDQTRNTEPSGINNIGKVVGYFLDRTGAHSFVYSDGSFIPLKVDFPNLVNTNATGINNHGTIVGSFDNRNGEFGFLGKENPFLVLKFPGATRTQARAINDTGVVVGTYWDSSKNIHGFVYSKGVYRTLDVAMARATGTQPFGINNKAEIVGFYEVDSVKHGFIYHEGHYTTLDFPGATRTQAFGINNLGVVVGVYSKGEKNLSFVATPALH